MTDLEELIDQLSVMRSYDPIVRKFVGLSVQLLAERDRLAAENAELASQSKHRGPQECAHCQRPVAPLPAEVEDAVENLTKYWSPNHETHQVGHLLESLARENARLAAENAELRKEWDEARKYERGTFEEYERPPAAPERRREGGVRMNAAERKAAVCTWPITRPYPCESKICPMHGPQIEEGCTCRKSHCALHSSFDRCKACGSLVDKGCECTLPRCIEWRTQKALEDLRTAAIARLAAEPARKAVCNGMCQAAIPHKSCPLHAPKPAAEKP